MRKVIYSIEGNIGSGKSTLLKALMGSMGEVTTIPQPVDSWQHVGGYNLLDKYYEDPVRWGYTFQINCILSRMNQLSKTIESMKTGKVYISQRSVQSDKFIFAKLMHRLKKINDMEYHLYLQMFKSLQGLFNKHSFSQQTTNKIKYMSPKSYISLESHQQSSTQGRPGAIQYKHIYLKTSAEKCFERIKKRNRVQERNLQFQYIKQLDNLHDQWLIDNKVDNQNDRQVSMNMKGNTLVLDGQREFESDRVYMNELISQIKCFIVENSQYPESFQLNNNSRRVNNTDQSRLKAQARNAYTK